MALAVRALEQADAEAAHALRHEAFGNPRSQGEAALPANRQNFGAFVGGGLIGCLGVICDASFFGGEEIPTAGISGVTVAAEHRGHGALTPLFDAALRYAISQGAALATLFPTASGIYRRLGFEIVAELTDVALPMASLGSLRMPPGVSLRRAVPGVSLRRAVPGVSLRRAVPGDAEAVRGLYGVWAREHNGPLARIGPVFRRSDEALVRESSAVTLAEREGQITGFVRWERGPGYGSFAHVVARELVAGDRDSAVALLTMLASFNPVAGELRLPSSGLDVLRTILPSLDWTVTRRNPYMLRVLDLARAFTLRRWPTIQTSLRFGVLDDRLRENSGEWALHLRDGHAACERTETAPSAAEVPVFTAAGLAMVYSGAWSCASVRRAAQLSGGRANDALLDTVLGGRQTHIRDYF